MLICGCVDFDTLPGKSEMQASQVVQFLTLSADAVVLYAVRSKGGNLVSLQVSAEAPAEMPKGATFGPFVPTDAEQAAIDMVKSLIPVVTPKADPMADRLRRSEVEKPVAYVLRYVAARTDLGRKDLIANLVAQGIATYTARTQVQVGLKRRSELAARLAALQAAADAEAARLAAEQAEGQPADQQEGQPAEQQ